MTPKWIEDSFKAKDFQPTEEYRVKIFLGVALGVFGFSLEECREIGTVIEQEHGVFVDNLEKIVSSKVNVNLLIIKSSKLKTYEDFLNGSPIPAVTEEWLRQCLGRKMYVRIDSYLIKKSSCEEAELLRRQSEIKRLLSEEKDLSKSLRDIENDDENHLFFSDCVFCFYKLSPQLESFLIKLTNLGGGTYSRELLLSTTHIIVENYSESDLLVFKKYNTFVHIMKPFWIKDCFHFKKKIFENDYYLMPSSIPIPREGLFSSKANSQGLGAIFARPPKLSADDATFGLKKGNEELSRRGKSAGGAELANANILKRSYERPPLTGKRNRPIGKMKFTFFASSSGEER